MDHLVGVAEIRVMLGGISRERVHQLARQPEFPAPIAVLTMGHVWTRESIEEWMVKAGRTEQI